MSLPSNDVVQRMVDEALAEDQAFNDCSSLLLPNNPATAQIVCREDAVLCGTPWVTAVTQAFDGVTLDWQIDEGASMQANHAVLTLSGPVRALLALERTALNFLQTLSAIATQTAQLVTMLAPFNTKLLDTRKTLPLWRQASKYAVRVGGGCNHRQHLADQILLKENHLLAHGDMTTLVNTARRRAPGLPIVIEIETLSQLETAICAGVDRIMLDNFSVDDTAAAVVQCAQRCPLELSGNVTAASIVDYAKTGVDFVSCGAITKHIRAIDFSMRLRTD